MRHLVVVGNGMVGQRFVDDVVARDSGSAPTWSVTVIGEERVAAYDRVALSSWFDGATDDDLCLCDEAGLRARGVDFRFGRLVETIDRAERVVHLDDGSIVPYDHLVLATGSTPFVPPVPGADTPGCFVYRTLDDLRAIRDWATDSAERGRRRGIVIGGGLLGLEAANALRHLGLDTAVVEMADQLLPQQLDPASSTMLHRWVTDLDIATHLGFATRQIEASDIDGQSRVIGLRGADDEFIPADIVVFSAGVRPRHELAARSGLAIGERGGVVIDDSCSTEDPHISAIGEVACHQGRTYGLVGPGYSMARILADRLTEANSAAQFDGADLSTKLKLLGIDVASFGESALSIDDQQSVYSDAASKIHRRIASRDGVLVGGVLVGDVSNYEILHAMATGTMPTREIATLVLPVHLIAGSARGDAITLPDTAQLCSCNNVTRGDVKTAIVAGCHDVASLKSETTAGTGCGGCLPGLSALLDRELEVRGVAVDRRLCEHFAHSRQELFDLIRFHGHSSWAAVVGAHGAGSGCAICRPTVGSILASLSTGYILDGDQAGLQDTNDHALANMQRNGTYSVVPRVPGGEITAAQLIALGRIAQDYDLYVKVTGAQRIDLFGAQLNELPAIWQRVIDAGMESGHAYGKALRTVKSCVGTTWCRYGVQDAVSMAIEIERRYRGLRSPHKLKSAVSGCARECAEAQSKDFGVIATESGWNLYVCGNGGRVPRHAELFATDLTDIELVTYVDRFLMFYIRTADRLERTSTWFEQLDGGVEYLRAVIVDDSLGICAELDSDMAAHVASYECEWAATLADPGRLAHFVEFVNAPDTNATPVWVSERGQRVPAPAGAVQ